MLSSRSTASGSTASKHSFNPNESLPLRDSSNSHDHCLQVPTIMTSTCILEFTRSQFPSAFPNCLDYTLQCGMIMCSNLTWLWPLSASLSSLCLGLPASQPPSTSLRSCNHGVVKWLSSHRIRREFMRMRGFSSISIAEGVRILRGTWLWGTTQNGLFYEVSARVHATKCWERETVYFI